MPRNIRFVLLVLVACFPQTVVGQTSFEGLGDLPGGAFSSRARDVSNDGTIVVGNSESDFGNEAFRWTADDGMLGLGDLPGGLFQSDAFGVSADGEVIVGSSETEYGGQPFRWTPASGMQPMADPFHVLGSAFGVAANGLTIVGKQDGGAERWDGPNLVRTALGPNGYAAFGVSSDGRVAVGYGVAGAMFQPIRWIGTTAEGLGGYRGEALAVNSDGSVVVGWTHFGVNDDIEFAFRWTSSGIAPLADVYGEWTESKALDVSADGSIIVGWGKSRSTSGEQAVVWDAVNGMRLLKDVLEHDFCLDLTGWNYLPRASAISDDGLVIVGNGVIEGGGSQAWIARITPLTETDQDQDGTPNCADGCPNDPTKVEPGACGCNVPDVDGDGDGFLDCLDNCPKHSNPEQRDCDDDGTGDVCAIATGYSPDCNGNVVPDGCDIGDGTSLDRNGNGIPDECDPDCNENDTPDDIDIAEDTSLDCNDNAVPDECDVSDQTSEDCNANSVPDECEIAEIHDCCEVGHGPGCNDPEIEACVCEFDLFCCLTDWDRTCTGRVSDGTCGTCEMVRDCNGNTVPDECESDCNGNGVADDCDITGAFSFDCQPNGVPDECEADFDADGTIDECDPDIDEDGIPNESDVCVFTPLGNPVNEQGRSIGDLDDDCLVTLGDYLFFAICLDISGPDHIPAFNDCIEVFDFNGDRDVDLRDFSVFEQSIVPDQDR